MKGIPASVGVGKVGLGFVPFAVKACQPTHNHTEGNDV